MMKRTILLAVIVLEFTLFSGASLAAPQIEVYTPVPHKGIKVGGWIKRQIHEDASNGWVFQLERLSQEGILTYWSCSGYIRPRYPFHIQFPPDKKDIEPNPSVVLPPEKVWKLFVPVYYSLIEKIGSYGHGEFEAHWMDMLFRQVWIGGYKQNEALAHKAIREVLASTDSTGYLGTNPPEHRFKGTIVAPWGMPSASNEGSGMGSIYDAFLTYYRFTGDKTVLDAVRKAADGYIEATRTENKMGLWAGGLLAMPLAKLYEMTGDQKYLDKAVEAWKRDTDMIQQPKEPGEFRYYKHHGATVGIVVLSTLELYRATGNRKYLDLALEMNDQVVKFAMQSHGAPTGHAEFLVPSSPGENTEGCESAWWAWDWMDFLSITGEAKYADLAEKAILNALQGCRTKDGTAAAYFMRTNQLFAAKGGNCGTQYGVSQGCDCCMGNMGRVLPVMAERMIMSDRRGGFVIPFYGPCSVEANVSGAGKVRITQDTNYPFSEDVKIKIETENGDAKFPIRLRKPGWCTNPQLKLNGKAVKVNIENSWIEMNRTWKSGDTIDLTLPMQVQVDRDKEGLAVVQRGPLLYALPVKGQRIPLDKWGSFEQVVTPADKWNYALVINTADTSRSFKVRKLRVPKDAHVWEYPPIALEVDAYRLADWKFSKPIKDLMPVQSYDAPEPDLPNKPYRTVGPPEKVMLVPFGFTLLRMTHLPVGEDD